MAISLRVVYEIAAAILDLGASGWGITSCVAAEWMTFGDLSL